MPVRGSRLRVIPIPLLLARCGNDRVTKGAVWHQPSSVAHEMDAWQGDERRKFSNIFTNLDFGLFSSKRRV